LAVIAALLSLTTATAMASADPTGTPSEPPPSSESSAPSEPSTPPSSESSAPPSSEPSESPAPPESDEEAAPAASTKDVTVTAAFDKPSYDTGESMSITLALKNTGADDIRVSAVFSSRTQDAVFVTATSTFEEFEEFTIAAGATVTNVLTGTVLNPNVTTGTLRVSLAGPGGPKESTFTVKVTKKVVTAAGSVFYDRNGNGQQDRGEGVRATLHWENTVNRDYVPTTTAGASGTFSIELIPGTYNVRGSSGDFVVTPREVTVPASGVDGVVLTARPRLLDLEVDLAFTKDTYKPTEAPTVRVTLTNNGNAPVTEVVADCYHSPDGPGLTGTGAGWGDLAGSGATVPAKSTKVLTVTEPMPEQAQNFGFVSVDCLFGYAELIGDLDNPRASDEAAVPGRTGDLSGGISSTDGAAIGGWRVVLTGKDGKCPIVAETKTDEKGRFALNDLPVGQYEVYVIPTTSKWLFKGSNHAPVTVVAGRDNHVTFKAFPIDYDNTLAPPPPCGDGDGGPGTNPPGPQGSPTPGLAYTGASMLVPGVVGLLALLAGIGTVLVTRRRRAG
jgi:hypothetical protein